MSTRTVEEIGRRMRKLRLLKKKGEPDKWTYEYVAEKLGHKGHSTYANYEYGRREPDIDTLNKIAEMYGVTTAYLLGQSPLDDFTDALELTDEELLERFNFTLDGKQLTEDDIKRIITYIRLERQLQKDL